MKRAIPVVLLLSLFAFKANATIHNVSVANFQFTPANILNVLVGDTIRWTYAVVAPSTTSHTTTCNPATNNVLINGVPVNSLPASADPWDSPMTTTSTTFDYIVKVAGTYNYSCRPHQENRGMVASFTASGALPVTMAGFSLSTANNKPGLNWKTLTEQNTDHFSVQRSYNGSDYTEIAKIPAAGNSTTERSYSYSDNTIDAKNKYAYYMIAIVDKDGKTQYTETKMFKNAAAINKLITSLSPNPINKSGHLMLQFNADKTGQMDVKVLNMEGKPVLQLNMYAVPGINNGHLHLGSLPAGTYNIIFRLDDVKETHRIIVK